MSILIKDMKMPKNCVDCNLYDIDSEQCPIYAIYKEDYSDKRFEKCPLIEVPTPHGWLIDADELIDGCEKLMRVLDPTEGKDYLRVFAIKSYLMWAAEYAVIKAEGSIHEQD